MGIMQAFYLENLQQVVQELDGKIFGLTSPSMVITGFSTDSRKLETNQLFIALRGEFFDGHDYVEAAVKRGAVALAVSDIKIATEWQSKLPIILVADTLAFYQALAAFYRRERLKQIVAVTGSVGKTTTRAMIVTAIGDLLAVDGTGANLNNEIGVPQTILSLPDSTDVGIIEMGMDHPGDLKVLSNVARPDIAVITNIGHSHWQNFGSQAAILAGKLEITTGLLPGGALVLNYDDSMLATWVKNETSNLDSTSKVKPYHLFLVATQEPVMPCPYPLLCATDIEMGVDGCYSFNLAWYSPEELGSEAIEFDLPRVNLRSPGKHHIINSLFAIQVARLLSLSLVTVIENLSKYQPVGNRQKFINLPQFTIIDDSYNAAPESMRAAWAVLRDLAKRERRRSVAVLGGIAELGDIAEQVHYQLGIDLATYQIDEVWVCGPWANKLCQGLKETSPITPCHVFATREELEPELLKQLRNGDVILVKGSHSFAMDKVSEKIMSRSK